MTEDADFASGPRGAMASGPAPARRSIALDADVLRWFEELALRSGGGDHESLINAVLRDHMRRAGEPLERTLRRVLREELRKAG
jgi:uncharacterized protein (DUF4415 family)